MMFSNFPLREIPVDGRFTKHAYRHTGTAHCSVFFLRILAEFTLLIISILTPFRAKKTATR
jgi:hypothetical protein